MYSLFVASRHNLTCSSHNLYVTFISLNLKLEYNVHKYILGYPDKKYISYLILSLYSWFYIMHIIHQTMASCALMSHCNTDHFWCYPRDVIWQAFTVVTDGLTVGNRGTWHLSSGKVTLLQYVKRVIQFLAGNERWPECALVVRSDTPGKWA